MPHVNYHRTWYSLLDKVNKIVGGRVIKGIICDDGISKIVDGNIIASDSSSLSEVDSPTKSVKYDDGTVEVISVSDLDKREVYYETDHGSWLYFPNRSEWCLWCSQYDRIMNAADMVDGHMGLHRDMDTDGFIALISLLGRFHSKWHSMTTEPIEVLELTPMYAVNEMIRELCLDIPIDELYESG
jgi:hypothetical protein